MRISIPGRGSNIHKKKMEKGKCSGVREPKDLHLVSLRELGDKGLIDPVKYLNFI